MMIQRLFRQPPTNATPVRTDPDSAARIRRLLYQVDTLQRRYLSLRHDKDRGGTLLPHAGLQ